MPVWTQEEINDYKRWCAFLDTELLEVLEACPDWSVRIEVPLPRTSRPVSPNLLWDPFSKEDDIVQGRCD